MGYVAMTDKGASEAAVQTAIRIRASELGLRLWRNNVGACTDETGRLIRYGLANDSAQMSKRIKSSDLIGWRKLQQFAPDRRVIIVAQFISIECKKELWKPGESKEREAAQKKWIDTVRADGGISGFARSVAEFEQILATGKGYDDGEAVTHD